MNLEAHIRNMNRPFVISLLELPVCVGVAKSLGFKPLHGLITFELSDSRRSWQRHLNLYQQFQHVLNPKPTSKSFPKGPPADHSRVVPFRVNSPEADSTFKRESEQLRSFVATAIHLRSHGQNAH